MARKKKSDAVRQIEAMAAASGITVGAPSASWSGGPGMLRAKYPGWCDRCGDQIGVDDPITIRHDKWICRKCAPGGDDE